MRYFRLPALLAVITSALLAAVMLVAASPARAAVNVPSKLDPAATRVFTAATVVVHRAGLPVRHIVKPGDTLAGLAVRYCHGVANDWTGFYHDNRKVIGGNPNLIFPGQSLALNRCVDPPKLLRLGSTYHAPARHAVTRTGKVWKVTYGYPYKCGDGDGDGWDRPCTHAAPAHRVYHAATSSRSYAGHYSFAGLEALWISAGGPAWAAAHAASIAECESGGNVNAYNPSGATGLWQILGAVRGGDLRNPYVNAANAVAKFKASGDT